MGKRSDIIGKQFNKWTVLGYAGKGMWKCRCSCGVEKLVSTRNLKDNLSKSCGHNTNKFIDLSGKQFGDYTVEEYINDGYWKCRCKCGNTVNKRGWHLRKGLSKYCNCKTSHKFNDLTGKTFGEWNVLEYEGKGYYKCTCSCGITKSVLGKSLRNGYSKSCGSKSHINQNQIDITGKQFGNLKVIRYYIDNLWECQCICGNSTLVLSHNLRNGSTTSCGCSRKALTLEELINYIDTYTIENNEKPFIYDLAIITGLNEATIRRYIKIFELDSKINHSFRSRYEKQIKQYIEDICGNEVKIVTNDRNTVNNYELDIYIPDKNLAIEFNGDYWHSTLYKDRNYHQTKKLTCMKQGIKLINVFEHEWLSNESDIKNYIKQEITEEYMDNTDYTEIEIDTIELNRLKQIEDLDNIKGIMDTDILYIYVSLDKALADRLIQRNFKLIDIIEPEITIVEDKTIFKCGKAIFSY